MNPRTFLLAEAALIGQRHRERTQTDVSAGAATHPIPERGAETGDAPARGRGDHLITRPHMKHVLPFPRAGTALTVAAAYIRIRCA